MLLQEEEGESRRAEGKGKRRGEKLVGVSLTWFKSTKGVRKELKEKEVK